MSNQSDHGNRDDADESDLPSESESGERNVPPPSEVAPPPPISNSAPTSGPSPTPVATAAPTEFDQDSYNRKIEEMIGDGGSRPRSPYLFSGLIGGAVLILGSVALLLWSPWKGASGSVSELSAELDQLMVESRWEEAAKFADEKIGNDLKSEHGDKPPLMNSLAILGIADSLNQLGKKYFLEENPADRFETIADEVREKFPDHAGLTELAQSTVIRLKPWIEFRDKLGAAWETLSEMKSSEGGASTEFRELIVPLEGESAAQATTLLERYTAAAKEVADFRLLRETVEAASEDLPDDEVQEIDLALKAVSGRVRDLSSEAAGKERETIIAIAETIEKIKRPWQDQTPAPAAESKPEPESPPIGNDLVFLNRRQKSYIIEFAAEIDSSRFQMTRHPSAEWPRRDSFIIKLGETSKDGQIRIDRFEEKQATNDLGIRVDASELTVTWLPTGGAHKLIRRVKETIPTYFAEFKPAGDGETVYVKEGDLFPSPADPKVNYRLEKVEEDQAVISLEKEPERSVRFSKGSGPDDQLADSKRDISPGSSSGTPAAAPGPEPSAPKPAMARPELSVPANFRFRSFLDLSEEVELGQAIRKAGIPATLRIDGAEEVYLDCEGDSIQGLRGKGMKIRQDNSGGAFRFLWTPEDLAIFRNRKLLGIWDMEKRELRAATAGESPTELEPPPEPKTPPPSRAPAFPTEERNWTGANGNSVKGSILKYDREKGTVVLKTTDGRIFNDYEIRKLSESDRSYLNELAGKAE